MRAAKMRSNCGMQLKIKLFDGLYQTRNKHEHNNTQLKYIETRKWQI